MFMSSIDSIDIDILLVGDGFMTYNAHVEGWISWKKMRVRKRINGKTLSKWQDIELIVGLIGYKFFYIYLFGVYNWIFNLGKFKKLFSMKFKKKIIIIITIAWKFIYLINIALSIKLSSKLIFNKII